MNRTRVAVRFLMFLKQQTGKKPNDIIKGVCAALTESRHRWRKGSCSSPPHAPSALFAFADDAVEKEKKKEEDDFQRA